MEKLKMGVLGCSTHFFKRVAVPIKGSRLVEARAIASRDLSRAREAAAAWGFAAAYGSYEELLADPSLDFVYIPLPNHLHLEWVRKAADAGKSVLCEKPLGMSAREAGEAADYCARKGVLLMEAFMYRFHPQWRRAAEIVASGELGRVGATQGFFSYSNRDPRNIRNVAEFGGGALLDIGCYAVSSARLLMGAEPLRVLCLAERDPEFGTDALASAILDFGDGRRGTFTVGTQLFSSQRVEACGTGGTLAIELPFNAPADAPCRLSVATDVGRRLVETEAVDQYLLEFEAFARSVAEGLPAPIPVSDAVANAAVLDALFASAASGAWERVARA